MAEARRAAAAYARAYRLAAADEQYHAAAFRGSFYLWEALRGFTMAGRDPLHGREWSPFSGEHRAAARAAHKALARFWLAEARKWREAGGPRRVRSLGVPSARVPRAEQLAAQRAREASLLAEASSPELAKESA